MNPYDPSIYDEDENQDMDSVSPASSIAGPQTPRDQVMQRISQVRSSSGDDDSSLAAPLTPPRGDDAAMQLARNASVTAGYGRALNALAAGTGYKADNSGYDALEKGQTAFAEKELARTAAVKKAIEDRKMKSAALASHESDKKAERDLRQQQIQGYNDRTKTMGALADSRQSTANIRAANTILNDKNAQSESKKLQTARSAQSLIEGIRNGEVKDSKNISKQLTNMITTIEMGAPGGVGDRQAAGVDTLYGKLQGALSYVSGHPNSTIPSAYLDQLESEVHALGDRAASNYKNLTDGSLSGADLSGGSPDADPGKVYALAKQRRDTMLKSSGYDPETGAPIGRRKQAAAGRVKARPGDIIKVKGIAYRVGDDGDSLEPAGSMAAQ